MIIKFNDYLNESKKEKHLSIDKWVHDLDPHIKGTTDDKIKPMFRNLPDRKIRPSYDILRSGKFIDVDGVKGHIIGIKNDMVLIDTINKDDKHEVVEMDIDKVIKKIKEKKK